MKNKMNILMKGLIVFGICYFSVEFLIHFSDLKLTGVRGWPEQALIYASAINHFFAAFVLLSVMLLVAAFTNIRKYKLLIKVTGLWTFGYGLYMVYQALNVPFSKVYASNPSLFLWIPNYNLFLLFEASLLLLSTVIIYFWQKTVDDKS